MVDMTNDVNRFEAMFSDRFTEKDSKFMELKSKPLPNPVVINPWKAQRKVWNRRWDNSSRGHQEDRSQRDRGYNRYHDRHRGDYDRHRGDSDRHRGEGNSKSNYRDRSNDRDRPRDKYDNKYDQDRDRNNRERKYDFQAALKSYSEK